MKLTALDIHHKEFRHSLRGYSEEEVDGFLDQVADEFDRLFKENIGTVRTDIPELQGELGVKISHELLRVLKEDKNPSENKKDFEARMIEDALGILQLKGAFE